MTDTTTRADDLVELAGANDEAEAAELLFQRGWTDGLPVVVPTPERVERFLAAATQAPDAMLGPIAPRNADLTLRALAANAVMAGCLPEYMPVLEAAVLALQQPDFRLYGTQMTTHPVALAVIVQGPIADEIGIVGGTGTMGSGYRANGAIGRAIRLVAMNIGGVRPGDGELEGDIDRATQGSPAKWSFCFGENRVQSPWPSFASTLGFDDSDSVVTVAALEGPHNVNDHQSSEAIDLLKTIAATIATPGSNSFYRGGDTFLALGPEHAAVLAAGGFTRESTQQWLFDNARVDATKIGAPKLQEAAHWGGYAKDLEEWGYRVPIAREPEAIRLIVSGGAGKHSAWLPTFGPTWSQSVRLPRTPGEGFQVAPLPKAAEWEKLAAQQAAAAQAASAAAGEAQGGAAGAAE